MENSVLVEKKFSLENSVFASNAPSEIKAIDNSDQDPNKLSEFASKEEGKELRSSKVIGNKSNEHLDIEAADKEQNEDQKIDFQSIHKEASESLGKSHENLANSSQDPEKFVETEDRNKEEWTKDQVDEEFRKEIEFSIEYSTVFGEKIVMIGSTEELGNWEVSKGLNLTWTENNIWSGKAELKKFPTEYKYVCLSDTSSRWEEGSNRVISKDSEITRDYWQ